MQINNNGQALGSPVTITVNATAASINSIGPATANTSPTIFTVTGTNLTAALTATIGAQTCTQQGGGTASQITFSCPLPSGAGNASFVVSSGGAALSGGTATITLIKLAAGNTGKLNDTGLQTCSDAAGFFTSACAGTGQDGEFGDDATLPAKTGFGLAGYDWTKVDANGYAMPNNATSWACIKDNVTGFIWEVKTNDGGLRDYRNLYTNLNDNSANDASTFVAAVNAAGLCGANDWRLPTVSELTSIRTEAFSAYASTALAIDSTAFPTNRNNGFYWSNNPLAISGSLYAWLFQIYTTTRSIRADSLSTPYPIRLVRSSSLILPGRYTISANYQEVTDNKTGLIWRRCPEGMTASVLGCSGTAATYTWDNAIAQGKNQALSSGIAWRVPNVNELESIVDRTRINPSIDLTAFPGTPITNFWTATAVEAQPSFSTTDAWLVQFNAGDVFAVLRTFTWSLRLVR